MASKIVVLGDVNGLLEEVFGKLSSLHSKQGFTFAIVAGNLFADTESASPAEEEAVAKLIKGEIDIPLPTHFSLGTRTLPAAVVEKLEKDDGELCANLYLLGRRASLKTAEGFRVVAVGGKHSAGQDTPMTTFEPTYSDADTSTLAKDTSSTDILVTNDWPASVRVGSKAKYASDHAEKHGVADIAELCTALKPRYFFSTSDAFFERDPFFHPGEAPLSITRFISLAPYGNKTKQKWIYAFSLEPSAQPPVSLPDGCTASPFTNIRASNKRKLESQNESYNSFRYSNGGGVDHYHGRRGKRHKPPAPTPDQCFFCLSNSACETHMIGSIGTECYVAIAKGPLTTRETYPDLGIPGHMLLVPLQHAPTLSLIPDTNVQKSTVVELQQYRNALHSMLASKTKDATGRAKLGAVTWEISRAGGVHLHWQFLPVPADMVQKGLVEAAFTVEAENLSYPRVATTTAAIADVEEAGDYLKVMIWSESFRKEIVLPIDQTFRFDLQFARKVMAKLLGLERRMDWRACSQTTEEETADANAFKEAFKEFDFALED